MDEEATPSWILPAPYGEGPCEWIQVMAAAAEVTFFYAYTDT